MIRGNGIVDFMRVDYKRASMYSRYIRSFYLN